MTATFLGVALAVGAFAGCGGPPAASEQLTAARAAYEETASAEDVSRLAPAALYEAREALDKAERAWRRHRDTAEVNHRAFVVRQRLRIARAMAELRATEEAIRQARLARQQALAELRATRTKASLAVTDTTAKAAPEVAEPTSPPPAPAETEPSPDPAVLGAVLTRRGLVLTLGEGAFAADGTALQTGAAPSLSALVDFLNEYPERRVRVEGFADDSGSGADALALSQGRADAVESALLERGITPERVATRAYGAAYPLVGDGPSDERRQNHRVEIVISGPQGTIPERE